MIDSFRSLPTWLFACLIALTAIVTATPLLAQNSRPEILITEVSMDPPGSGDEWCELTNVTRRGIDTTGWELHVWADSNRYLGQVSLPSSVMASLAVITCTDNGPNRPWSGGNSTIGFSFNIGGYSNGGLMLLDASGNVKDFVVWGPNGVNPSTISSPASVGSEWTGSNAPECIFNQSIQRTGTADNNSAVDWSQVSTPSLGTLNTGLNIKVGNAWTGAIDSDWNKSGNWDPAEVPSNDTDVIIESAAIQPIITTSSRCNSVTVEPGAVLTLRDILNVNGDVSVAVGGSVIVNGGGWVIKGEDDQVLTTGGVDLGDISIENNTGTVYLESNAAVGFWENQTGHIDAVVGSTIAIEPTLPTYFDFSGNTADIRGTVSVQVPAVAVANPPTMALIMPAQEGFKFGDTTIRCFDPDTLIVGGHVGFGDLTLSGDGFIDFLNVTFNGNSFPSEVTEMNDFRSTLQNDMTFAGNVIGSGDFVFDGPAGIDIFGDLQTTNLVHDSTAALHILGSIDATGNVTIDADGSLVSDFDLNAANVTATDGILTISGNGVVTGSLTVRDDAQVEYVGLLQAKEVLFPGNGNLSLGQLRGVGPAFPSLPFAELLEVSGDGTFAVTGAFGFFAVSDTSFGGNGIVDSNLSLFGQSLIVGDSVDVTLQGTALSGNIDLVGSGTFTTNSTTSLEGDLDDRSTGIVNVASLVLSGTVRQEVLSDPSNGHVFSMGQLVVDAGASGELDGVFDITGVGGGSSIFISVGAGLELAPNAEIVMSSAAVEDITVQGSFVATPATIAQRPSIVSTGAGFHFTFNNGSIGSITGLKISGLAGQDGMLFGVGSRVAALNGLEIQNGNVTGALLRFQSNEVPPVMIDFDPFVGAASPSNTAIDASAITGVTVDVSRGPLSGTVVTGQSSVFGTNFENDPNNVIIWEDPPQLEITTPRNLANALVDTQYDAQLTSIGGNQPVVWTLNNAPSWIVLNSASGLISGVPPLTAAGSFQFVATATDASNPQLSASKALVLVVDELVGVPLQLVLTELVPAEEGRPYSSSMVASGGIAPYAWNLVSGTMPDGLIFTQSGFITGTPRVGTVGTYPIRVRLTDARDEVLERTYNFRVQSEQVQVASLGHGGAASSCSLQSSHSQFWLYLLLLLGAVSAVSHAKRLRTGE